MRDFDAIQFAANVLTTSPLHPSVPSISPQLAFAYEESVL